MHEKRLPTAMGHAEDPAKWAVDDEAHDFAMATVTNKDPAVEDALDAEANIEHLTTATNTTVERTSDPGPPPNGGFAAWLQVLGSFFLFFNGW